MRYIMGAMGYHKTEIMKGVLGQLSKIQEELDELKDAHEQGLKILEICELADLIGAVDHYLEQNHPSLTVQDLRDMAKATRQAFADGSRK